MIKEASQNMCSARGCGSDGAKNPALLMAPPSSRLVGAVVCSTWRPTLQGPQKGMGITEELSREGVPEIPAT